MRSVVRHYSEGESISVNDFPDWVTAKSLPTLVVLFCSRAQAEARGAEMRKILPQAYLIGCSTAGEIYQDQVSDETLVVSLLQFDQTPLKMAFRDASDMNVSRQVGMELAEELWNENLRAVFVLSQGSTVNGSELAKGFNLYFSNKNSNIPVTGGLAGDGANFQKTFVIGNDQVSASGVVAVGFYGDKFRLLTGRSTGWEAFGPERKVSKSKGSLLYEIDQQPALELYKSYLGDMASELPSSALFFPLMVQAPGGEPLVRTILNVNQAENSMTFAGDIAEGATVQLMRTSFFRLLENAKETGTEMQNQSTDWKSPHLFAVS